jgi:hypothetical protein
MLEYMEDDLKAKALAAYISKEIASSVYGIFSLDDLEEKEQSELGRQLVIGVGYVGAEPAPKEQERQSRPNQQSIDYLRYKFLILIAIPVDNGDAERYSATQLLTILRKGVAGIPIAGDRASRMWTFESEAPRIAESSSTMMYYAQVWRVDLPNVATTS